MSLTNCHWWVLLPPLISIPKRLNDSVVFWVGRWVSPTEISKAQVPMMMMMMMMTTGFQMAISFSVSLCLDLVFETQSIFLKHVLGI